MATTAPSESTHLWEHDHSYYCSEGCYYVPGTQWSDVHADWESWQDFLEDWGNVDPDYNLLFRWDWDRYEDSEDLKLFFYMQRKAKPFSHTIKVTEDDEDSVRTWLIERAEHMRKLWSPLLDGVTS